MFIKRRTLQVAEAKLKEAAKVSLGYTTDHDCEEDNNRPNGENNLTQHPEFENLSSGEADELRRLSDVDNGRAMNSSDDLLMEEVIMSLIRKDESFNNPFQVADRIRREMIFRTEQARGRAVSWILVSLTG